MIRMLQAGLVASMAVCATAWAQSSRAPTNQSAEEIVIKEKLSLAGITGLKDLTRNRDGTWNGRGMKDNSEVAVVVDTDGKVRFR